MLKHQSHPQKLTRSGFTLVELLVALMITAILVALIGGALGSLLGNTEVVATQATIIQIDDIIQARYDAIKSADVSVEAKKLSVLNSSISEKEAEFLIRKTLYRQALPQRPEDLFGLNYSRYTGSGVNDDAPYTAEWTSANGGANTSSDDSHVTAAEVFFFAVTKGSSVRALPGGKSYSVPLLQLDNFNQSHIADIDGDGLDEFTDEWGTPFHFYNFPTHLFRRDGDTSIAITSADFANVKLLISGLDDDLSSTGPLARDPLDPTGLYSSQFFSSSNLTYAPSSTLFREAFDVEHYHIANTYYVPLLVSAGPDLLLGLGEPTSTTFVAGPPDVAERLARVTGTTDNLTDNLTNRQ